MLGLPKTLDEAKLMTYGDNSWVEGTAYIEGRCAMSVRDRTSRFPHYYQCTRKAITGPGNLYCKTHAAIFDEIGK